MDKRMSLINIETKPSIHSAFSFHPIVSYVLICCISALQVFNGVSYLSIPSMLLQNIF